MKHCPNCGAQLSNSAQRFCGVCGFELAPTSEQKSTAVAGQDVTRSNKSEFTSNKVTFISSIITVLSFAFPFYDDKMGLSYITGSSGLLLSFILQIGSILVFLNRTRLRSAGQTKRILLILNCVSFIGLLAASTDVIQAEHLTFSEVWPGLGYILACVATTIALISVLTISKEPVGFCRLLWSIKMLLVLSIIIALIVTASIELNPEKNAVLAYYLWSGQLSQFPSYDVGQITSNKRDWYVSNNNRIVAIKDADGNSISSFVISLDPWRSKVGKNCFLACSIMMPSYIPFNRLLPIAVALTGQKNDGSNFSLTMGKVELVSPHYFGFYSDYTTLGAVQTIGYKKLVELANSSKSAITCDFLENGRSVQYTAELSNVNKEIIRKFCEQYR